MARSKEPRGIRNNNPLNIDRNEIKWQGMAKDQSGDRRFVVFQKPEYGIRAGARIMRVYQREHGINTIEGLVSRWAPPVENDTDAYIRYVEMQTGYTFREELDFMDDDVLLPIMKAMIKMECGVCPYDNATLLEGIRMERPKKKQA